MSPAVFVGLGFTPGLCSEGRRNVFACFGVLHLGISKRSRLTSGKGTATAEGIRCRLAGTRARERPLVQSAWYVLHRMLDPESSAMA